MPLYHIDLYRLEAPTSSRRSATSTRSKAVGLAVVEWGDRFAEAQPAERVEARLDIEGDELRAIEVTGRGPSRRRAGHRLARRCARRRGRRAGGVVAVNPLVLALDTATEVVAVGIGRRSAERVETMASCDSEAPRAAMSRLLPCVEDLLAALGLGPSDLDEIVVGRGPGFVHWRPHRRRHREGSRPRARRAALRRGHARRDRLAHRAAIGGICGGRRRPRAGASRRRGRCDAGRGLPGAVPSPGRGGVAPRAGRCRQARRCDRRVGRRGRATRARRQRPAQVRGAGSPRAWAPWRPSPPRGCGPPQGPVCSPPTPRPWRVGAAGSGEPGELLPVYTRLSDAEEAEHGRSQEPRAARHIGQRCSRAAAGRARRSSSAGQEGER